jgi:hypothetical protein
MPILDVVVPNLLIGEGLICLGDFDIFVVQTLYRLVLRWIRLDLVGVEEQR